MKRVFQVFKRLKLFLTFTNILLLCLLILIYIGFYSSSIGFRNTISSFIDSITIYSSRTQNIGTVDYSCNDKTLGSSFEALKTSEYRFGIKTNESYDYNIPYNCSCYKNQDGTCIVNSFESPSPYP